MKVILKSLGVKREKPEPIAVSTEAPKTEYPSLSLSSKNLKGIESLEVGKKCILTLQAEVKSMQKGAEWNSEEGMRADFKLLKGHIEPAGKGHKNLNEAGMAASREAKEY